MRWALVVLAVAWAGCSSPSVAGLRCVKHEDCRALAEGYCARAGVCTRLCDERTPCPSGTACVTADARQVCLTPCDLAADGGCGAGFRCQTLPGGDACVLERPMEPLPGTAPASTPDAGSP